MSNEKSLGVVDFQCVLHLGMAHLITPSARHGSSISTTCDLFR